ncbi:MAG: hypothetical protein LUH15_07065 [Tannerellaceae bacterium]|nr:hypothetical protein [Tannerellaceae bacterium]
MKKKILLSIFLILPFALMAQQLEVQNPAIEEVNADGLSIHSIVSTKIVGQLP